MLRCDSVHGMLLLLVVAKPPMCEVTSHKLYDRRKPADESATQVKQGRRRPIGKIAKLFQILGESSQIGLRSLLDEIAGTPSFRSRNFLAPRVEKTKLQ